MNSPAEFAREMGVAKSSVHRAIEAGRLAAYDEEGTPLRPDDRTRFKFLRPEEAALAWRLSRKRIDDCSDQSLVSRRIAREQLQGDLLRVKLARERGELVDRRASKETLATAGALLAREIQTTLPSWGEELCSVAKTGNIPATTQWLRAKTRDFCNRLADLIVAGAEREPEAQAPN